MHTGDIEKRDNKFSAGRHLTFLDVERELIEQILAGYDSEHYRSPSSETPIPAETFVCWLETGFMSDVLKQAYPRYENIKERLPPRVRFLAYFALSRTICLKKAYRRLEPEDFYNMGFNEVPNYELLRVFVYEKIGRENLKSIFDLIVLELKRLLKRHDIDLGQRIGEDATDVRALKHDKEADYSGYYKEYGYKLDILHDLDQETLPLDYKPLSINEDEGKCTIGMHNHLCQQGIRPNEWNVDGKYATYSNIANLQVRGTRLIFRIQDAWKLNPKGTDESIKKRYQTYHRHGDFVAGASLKFMLAFLMKMGDDESVGAYFRNQAMERYEAAPKEYLEECHERSGKTEGMMGTVKIETALDMRLPRRGWNAFKFTADISMLAFVFAALIRLQNNDTERLGNLTYIT